MGEHKAERHVHRRGSGGDVAVAEAVNTAVLKPSRGRTKNEIHMAHNVTVVKILAPAIEQDRVLPAEEPTVAEHRPVPVHAEGEGLPDRAGGILKREIFGGEIIRIDRGGRGLERANGAALGIGDAGVQVKRQHGVGGVVADQLEKSFFALEIDEFAIDAGGDVNHDGVLAAAGRHRHDGRLNRLERRPPGGGHIQVRLSEEGGSGSQQRQQCRQWKSFHSEGYIGF